VIYNYIDFDFYLKIYRFNNESNFTNKKKILKKQVKYKNNLNLLKLVFYIKLKL